MRAVRRLAIAAISGGRHETDSLSRHLVTVTNGSPGITTLKIEVNGVRLDNLHLGDGERVTVDVARAMRPGDDNTFSFTTTGKPGASAAVMIHD